MAEAKTPHELFVHELAKLYAGEQKISELLVGLATEAGDEQLRLGLERHLIQTHQHVDRLEEVFHVVGVEPHAHPSPALDGLEEEHESAMSQTAIPLRDHVVAASAAATEHHEIAAYERLLALASAIHREPVVRLLSENLAQEQDTLAEARRILRRLAKDKAG